MEYFSESLRETSSLAKLLAEEILVTKPTNRSLVVALMGKLGTGKTVFIRALLPALGVKGRVVSPTFIFSRRFKSRSRYYKNIWHFDVYRLNSGKEAKGIGLTEAINTPQTLVLIEWADKVKNILPQGTIWVAFKHGVKPNERHITFNRR